MIILLSKYKNIIALVCFCAISLALSWLTMGAVSVSSAQGSDSLERNLSTLLTPVYFCSSIISSISSGISRVGTVFASVFQKPVEKNRLKTLESKVEQLEIQLDMERADYRRLKEFYENSNMAEGPGIDENSSIDAMTDSEQVHNFRLAAKVIAVEPTDWFRYLTIDKGEKDGVAEDMAIIAWPDSVIDTPYLTGAVIGKVVDVQKRSAKVQLITDRLSIVAVTIGSQGDLALMRGKSVKENCVIDEILLTTHDMLKEGDAVVVDERSSVFPPGMLVGWISSIEEKGIEEKGTYFCRIVIEPAFKFNKLREVMVLRNN